MSFIRDKNGMFSQDALNKYVTESIETRGLDPNAKLAFIADVNAMGIKTAVSIKLFKDNDKVTARFMGVYEHNWNGDDSVAGSVLFQVK